MQQVVGAYESFEAAEAAVRSVESRGVSIQNLVIANERQRVWRKFHDWRPHHGTAHERSFVVYMNDDADHIERVRSLLRGRSASAAL